MKKNDPVVSLLMTGGIWTVKRIQVDLSLFPRALGILVKFQRFGRSLRSPLKVYSFFFRLPNRCFISIYWRMSLMIGSSRTYWSGHNFQISLSKTLYVCLYFICYWKFQSMNFYLVLIIGRYHLSYNYHLLVFNFVFPF